MVKASSLLILLCVLLIIPYSETRDSITKQDLVKVSLRLNSSLNVMECFPNYDLGQHLSRDQTHPYYVKTIMEMYSKKACDGPLTIEALHRYLGYTSVTKDGGSTQCPEVTQWFTLIANSMKDNSIYCDIGFDEGMSAATFLLGGLTKNITVHSFDFNDSNLRSVLFLKNLFGDKSFIFHMGNVEKTLPEFLRQGNRCDVVFIDISTPTVFRLVKRAVKPNALVIYHWHFRKPENREFLVNLHRSHSFNEKQCMLTRCSLSRTGSSGSIVVRETCVGSWA